MTLPRRSRWIRPPPRTISTTSSSAFASSPATWSMKRWSDTACAAASEATVSYLGVSSQCRAMSASPCSAEM